MQDCAPGLHGPWIEAFKELRKKGQGKSSWAFAAVAHLRGRAALRKAGMTPRSWVPPWAPHSPDQAASRDVGRELPQVDGLHWG